MIRFPQTCLTRLFGLGCALCATDFELFTYGTPRLFMAMSFLAQEDKEHLLREKREFTPNRVGGLLHFIDDDCSCRPMVF